MSGGVNYLAFFLSFFALTGIIFTTAFWEWKRSSVHSSENYLAQSYIAQGLWVRCSFPQPGEFRCDTYDVALLGLPIQIQVMRAMMCLSIIASLISVFCAGIVLPCTNFGERQKINVARVGGILNILAGLLCLASVSWYAAIVIYEFYSILSENNQYKFEFGSSLYVGWVSSGLALVAGALLACCNCSGGGDNVDSYHYSYRPPQSNKPGAKPAEYV